MAICEAAKRMRDILMRVEDKKCIVCVGVVSDCRSRVDLNVMVVAKILELMFLRLTSTKYFMN